MYKFIVNFTQSHVLNYFHNILYYYLRILDRHYKKSFFDWFFRLLQDVTNSSRSVCESSVVNKRLTVTFGQSVHLSCFVKMPQVLKVYPITWYHHSKEKGRYTVSFRYKIRYYNIIIIYTSSSVSGQRRTVTSGVII